MRYFKASTWFLLLVLPLQVGASSLHLTLPSWEPSTHLHLVRKGSQQPSIKNIRAHRHKKFTRVVLDLTKQVLVTPKDRRTPKNFQLEIPKTRITKRATEKIRRPTFPLNLEAKKTKSGSVVLTVPIEGWKAYKWYALEKPPRLVLDLYPGKAPKTPSPKAKPPKPTSAKAHKAPPSKPTRSRSKQKAALRSQPKPPQPSAEKQVVVVIDPGHGGKDPGASGKKGTREKDIVLNIARHLREYLKKNSSAKVLMTRNSDVFVKLEDRAKFANKHKADVFISIHINSHKKSSIKGLELYHFGEASDPRALEVAARENGTPLQENAPAWQFILADKLNDKKIEDSQELAWVTKKALVKHLRSYYKVKDHGVKTAPFFVLRMTTMPAVLAEVAFISNPKEEKLLKTAKYQKRMARGIYKGLNAYLTPLRTASR